MDRRLTARERTWTNLKRQLLRRYAPRLAWQWRNDEEAADRNPVSERVLLAQFLRSLDKTTRQLVKQRPKPKTLEEAVDKATEIDDSMDNVAQGMQNTRQSFPTAQTSHVSQAAICNDAFDYENRRNRWPGRRQVGAVLEPSGLKTRGKGKKAERKREAKQPQRKRDRSESSEVEATEKPVARKLKAAVKQVTPEDNRSGDTRTVQVLPALLSEQEQQKAGQVARECTDPEGKARNYAYMKQREERIKAAENSSRAS
ncbi:hypothetical protein F443_01665 [Phytophthora nicotianae P1569]|uniref:Uncharacterized protein n=1 Tax=Phytophthora nicotianae P1569 TaxID=1317065 RepID=V9FW00_PHYNI|nr:hypothetical protein F443_01665 [Phytophthora nicotianae P1569]